jgi:predicted nucleotidyltransferase
MDVSQKIKESIAAIEPTARVVLFGSRARKDNTEHSDWDILVLLKQPQVSLKDEQRIRHSLFDVELENGVAISTFVQPASIWNLPVPPNPLMHKIKVEGRFL